MANYATNIFYARTENKADLDKIEAFLDDTFDGFVNRHSDSVDAEFNLSLGLSGRRNRQTDSFVGSQRQNLYQNSVLRIYRRIRELQNLLTGEMGYQVVTVK